MDQQTDCDEQHPCDAQSYSREYLFCMTASEPAGGVQCGFPGISDTFWTRAPWSGAQRRHVVLARRSPDAWTPVARLPAASQNVITMQHMDPATQRGSALQGSFQQASSLLAFERAMPTVDFKRQGTVALENLNKRVTFSQLALNFRLISVTVALEICRTG